MVSASYSLELFYYYLLISSEGESSSVQTMCEIKRISSEILSQSQNCDKNYACQTPEWKGDCVPLYMVEDFALEVDGKNPHIKKCPYSIELSGRFFCTCSSRIEIYKKYKV